MRILTAVALPACPRSISCRGSRTVSSECRGYTERGSLPRCCLGQQGGAADSCPSHPPTSKCGLPYASLSGWLYIAVHGNSSCVCSGQRKKQHLISSATQIKKDEASAITKAGQTASRMSPFVLGDRI